MNKNHFYRAQAIHQFNFNADDLQNERFEIHPPQRGCYNEMWLKNYKTKYVTKLFINLILHGIQKHLPVFINLTVTTEPRILHREQ